MKFTFYRKNNFIYLVPSFPYKIQLILFVRILTIHMHHIDNSHKVLDYKSRLSHNIYDYLGIRPYVKILIMQKGKLYVPIYIKSLLSYKLFV